MFSKCRAHVHQSHSTQSHAEPSKHQTVAEVNYNRLRYTVSCPANLLGVLRRASRCQARTQARVRVWLSRPSGPNMKQSTTEWPVGTRSLRPLRNTDLRAGIAQTTKKHRPAHRHHHLDFHTQASRVIINTLFIQPACLNMHSCKQVLGKHHASQEAAQHTGSLRTGPGRGPAAAGEATPAW